MVTDGAGNITNASTMDANLGGTVSNAPVIFTGTYTAGGAGRYTLGLSSFAAGSQYAAYPSSAGLAPVGNRSDGIMSGVGVPTANLDHI